MRDIILTGIISAAILSVLWRPYLGIYLWAWLGYMNPQKLTYGFAYDMPYSFVTAIVTISAYLLSREPKRFIWSAETVFLLLLIGWMFLTNFFAFYPDQAWFLWNKVWKIQLMTFLTMMLITNRQRLHGLVWIIALSIGYYGVKGGVFTLMTGGAYIVWGPAETFIEGNNELALALIMIIPLIRYLHLQTKRAWVRHGLAAAMLLCAVSAIGSQSRGAFLAIMSMGLFLWLKSRHKATTGVLALVVLSVVATLMPASWYQRMDTIETYHQDASAMGRINAWHVAFNVAKDKITGGGFNMFQPGTFKQYAPDPNDVHDAHSIYFQMMGNHGFIGLGLWLAVGLFAWFKAGKVIRACKNDPERKWASDLAAMIQVSLVGYATGGAFLGLAYFDLYYHLIIMVVITYQIAVKEQPKSLGAASGVVIVTPASNHFTRRFG